MPNLLLLLEGAYEIRCFRRFGRRHDKNPKLEDKASVGKEKFIRNVNNIVSYAMPHNSANILGGGLSSTSVVERVCLISQKVKDDTC